MSSKSTRSARLVSDYEYLERARLRKLHLNETYARFYLGGPPGLQSSPSSGNWTESRIPGPTTFRASNSLLPFSTMGKTTCGYAFNQEADNRRPVIDVIPTDLTRLGSTVVQQQQFNGGSKQTSEHNKQTVRRGGPKRTVGTSKMIVAD